ncbi:MAG: DUF475 domain-containing protein [Candidatus Peribacteria bacterium]|nr:MAG: DUF475 domain-containing protein [Candidatus Peribacteria bacterium]
MQELHNYLQDIISYPGAALAVVGNLIIIESLLSVDNAAVLATMVMDLPEKQRRKALRYGIIGAYLFRGLSLIFVSYLIKIWWLKPMGGLYLLYLVYDYIQAKLQPQTDSKVEKESHWIYKFFVGHIGQFWSTVALVEAMDLAFSIDNVFAAAAFTPNIILIWTGVFIGILAMRFVAQAFVKLMETYAFLADAAFLIIGILGCKLTLSLVEYFYPDSSLSHFLQHDADIYVSVGTVLVFFVLILSSRLFGYPRKTA